MTDVIDGQNARLYLDHVDHHGIDADITFVCNRLVFRPGESVLDVGYGTGRLLLKLANQPTLRLSGVEKSQALYENSRRQLHARGISCYRIDFNQASQLGQFDTLIMSFFLHHLGNLAGNLVLARQLLAPGGRLVIYDRVLLADDDAETFNTYWEEHYAADHEWEENRPQLFSCAQLQAVAGELGLSVSQLQVAPHDQKPGTGRFPKTLAVLESVPSND